MFLFENDKRYENYVKDKKDFLSEYYLKKFNSF